MAAESVMWAARVATPDVGAPNRDGDVDQLVVRYKGGDASAFSVLYEHFFDSVYSYAQLMLRDRHQAEDVAQDVFAKALRGIDCYQVRPGMPFRAWLFRIARNSVIDVLRLSDRLSFREPASIESLQEDSGSCQPVAVLDWINDSELAVLLRRLPTAQRDVLFMRYVLDMPTEQIASVMDRTPKAVRNLQSRALKSLEGWLGAMGRRHIRRQRVSTLLRIRPAPVMAARRFALAYRRPGGGRAGNRWGV